MLFTSVIFHISGVLPCKKYEIYSLISHKVVGLCALPLIVLFFVLVIVGKSRVHMNLEARIGMIVMEWSGIPIWVVCALAYSGILAGLCLCLFLKARTTTSHNNNQRFISFGIIFGFLVGIAFVPAYYSTQGKFLVVIQAFSITAIAYGILGCLFFPSCYAIFHHVKEIK